MNIHVTKTYARRGLPRRIRIECEINERENLLKLNNWLDDNKIKHYRVNKFIFYIGDEDATFLLLKWS